MLPASLVVSQLAKGTRRVGGPLSDVGVLGAPIEVVAVPGTPLKLHYRGRGPNFWVKKHNGSSRSQDSESRTRSRAIGGGNGAQKDEVGPTMCAKLRTRR